MRPFLCACGAASAARRGPRRSTNLVAKAVYLPGQSAPASLHHCCYCSNHRCFHVARPVSPKVQAQAAASRATCTFCSASAFLCKEQDEIRVHSRTGHLLVVRGRGLQRLYLLWTSVCTRAKTRRGRAAVRPCGIAESGNMRSDVTIRDKYLFLMLAHTC